MSDRPGGFRPDPDALLEQLQREESDARRRGRLKVFLGASAGVGKTFAMLTEAQERARAGTNVAVGVVETHGRKETEALLRGLEIVPRRRIEHRGVPLAEFDLDAALARRPELLLVDELAHTNAPGSRHAKRWQDVEELLSAGIDVFTTVNVQHLESLNDLVARITHVVVRETLPDSVVEEADEIELVDLAPDDLLQRLREGKVYLPEQAKRATESFFRKENLIALRQMAMRKAAAQVDAQMRVYRRALGVPETWPVRERILVGVGPAPSSQQLVRAAKRMADQLSAEWIALFVETPEYAGWPEEDRNRIWETLRLAESLGGKTATISGARASAEMLAYARTHNISVIAVGKPTHPRWRDLLFGSKLETVARGSGDIDVYVISGRGDRETSAWRAASPIQRHSSGTDYLWAAALIAVATALGVALRGYLEIANLAMIYLLAVVVVAVRLGRGPSIVGSVLSVAAFDFFCVPPYNTFAVRDTEYVVTFGVLLVVALTISTLTTRIAQQAEAARERERRTGSLYAIAQSLVRVSEPRDLVQVGVQHINETFSSEAVVFLIDALGDLSPVGRTETRFETDAQEQTVARWVHDQGRPAGLGTDTLSGAHALYLPLGTGGGVVGVLGVRPTPEDRFRAPEQLHLLETFAALIAVAVEQARLAEEARTIQQLEEMDRLKSEFIAVASHELRTPLASLASEIALLRERLGGVDERERHVLDTAQEDMKRLRALVDDLLDLSKLESGRTELELRVVEPRVLVQDAIRTFSGSAEEKRIQLGWEISADAPPVFADAAQVERVLSNLISNALRFTDEGGRILVAADNVGEFVQFSVSDNGRGIPLESQSRIFDSFVQRDRARSADGTGLGLAISRAIVRAHGGEIWVDSGPGPGSVFTFTMPVAKAEDAEPSQREDTA
jgi:two-component system sensor histidine kinase KdpD